ncbi:MBL fold metallo-hydrolase [Ammoniphilus sp. CFH 90114]|nr:MBL fold metallo-hydrolase [Ammoniphilus sp. CFH 90114]
MVIDGGTKDSGRALVDHIKKYYGTTVVDYVVNSHPDADHASGLTVVLEELEVKQLWMHRPWEHSQDIREAFKDGRITEDSLYRRLQEALNHARNLEEIAIKKGIDIYEPFEGEKIGDFVVLSPSKPWYQELLPEFRSTPEQQKKEEASIVRSIFEVGQAVIAKIKELWDVDSLSEDGKTSAENNSSVVMFAKLDEHSILLTADAGIEALNKAADYAESNDIDLTTCKFIQVPHHGSRRNVSPSVLNRIVGEKVEKGSKTTKVAFVSASKESEKHPRANVVNAFIRRGAKVIATKGSTKGQRYNFPARDGWTVAEPMEFSDEVDE